MPIAFKSGKPLFMAGKAAENCSCCSCAQPTASGIADNTNNGWQPKDAVGKITFVTSLPITHRFRIEASSNCGGTNSSVQKGSLSCFFSLDRSRTIKIKVSGYVEQQNDGYDYGTISVAGVVAQISSYGRNLVCAQTFNTNEKTINLPAGTFNYTMSVDTRDGLFHANTEYTFVIQYA